jgi:hypothetical protein
MTTDPKLSDTQRVILNAACQREGRRVFPITATRLTGGAVGNVLRSLIRRRLIEPVSATPADTVWAHDDEGAPLTLRATMLALNVLGIEPDDAPAGATSGDQPEVATDAATEPKAAPDAPAAPKPRKTRADSKQARLIAMLRRPEGASIPEIAETFGWANHTVRGAIAGALKKKLGLDVSSEKDDARGRVYRIIGEG